jgi:hypothetical protein
VAVAPRPPVSAPAPAPGDWAPGDTAPGDAAQAATANKVKAALPVVGAAAGVGFLAWALRRARAGRR